jgi:hypothetical protein
MDFHAYEWNCIAAPTPGYGRRVWSADELRATTDSVFPPDLGERLARLLVEGCPAAPIDIG